MKEDDQNKGSIMKMRNHQLKKSFKKWGLLFLVLAGLVPFAPVLAQAGNVGWNVSVGGGYGGGWRPAAYGPGWGGWRGGYYGGGYGYPYGAVYYAPSVVYSAPMVYAPPPQPMVLVAQPQAPVWYFCEASGKYFPYAQNCASGWLVQPAMPPSGHTGHVQ